MQEYSLVFDQSESNTFGVFQAHHLSRCGTWYTSCCRVSLPMRSEDLLLPVAHARVWVVSRLKICVEQHLNPTRYFTYRNNQLIEATYRKYILGIQNSSPISVSKFEGTPWYLFENTSIAAYSSNRTV
jgi:hypothetical protein